MTKKKSSLYMNCDYVLMANKTPDDRRIVIVRELTTGCKEDRTVFYVCINVNSRKELKHRFWEASTHALPLFFFSFSFLSKKKLCARYNILYKRSNWNGYINRIVQNVNTYFLRLHNIYFIFWIFQTAL